MKHLTHMLKNNIMYAIISLFTTSFSYSNAMTPVIETIGTVAPDIVEGAIAAGAILADMANTKDPMPLRPNTEEIREDSNGTQTTASEAIRDAVITGYFEETNKIFNHKASKVTCSQF